MKNTHLSLLCLSLLAACSLEPPYKRPPAPVPTDWPTGSAYQDAGDARTGAAHTNGAQPGVSAADIGWREFFTDPRLQRLIGLALDNNRDLRIATLNVEAMRAKYRIQRSSLFPTVNALAGSTTVHEPSSLEFAGQPPTIYSLGVGVTSYELDFFGRVRSLKDQALQQYFATEAAQRSAQIALVSEVANAYLTWEANQELLALAQQTLASQQSGFNTMTQRVAGRVSSQLDLQRAQTQVQTASAAVDQYRRQAAQSENELTLLIGGPLPADLPPPRPLNAAGVLANLPAGLPSDLLDRRPDIVEAEDQLKAANANIGAARAAFFPRISRTGTLGLESMSLAKLFASGMTWTFAPLLTLPIFDAGSNRANLDVAHVEKNIYVARYEKSIQTAFREVADGLAGRATLESQARDQQALVDTTAKSYDLSMMRYRAGMGDYFDALDTQRSLFTAQQTLVAVQLARLTNLVTFYKALGGGWRETAPVQQAGQPVPQAGQPVPQAGQSVPQAGQQTTQAAVQPAPQAGQQPAAQQPAAQQQVGQQQVGHQQAAQP